MKKLNKKGFTLVELLAVIVILAILIAVVATTALPAMTNAKQKASDTYAARLNAKAKEMCLVDKINSTDSNPCTYDSIEDLMGAASSEYQIKTAISVSVSSGVASVTAGEIESINDNSIVSSVAD